jgi:DNA-binding LacI/PurR family transcriptional regulator
MTILQKDIAETLNLSVTTVSMSLRQDPRIPQETRARVLSLAARSGYRPKTRSGELMVNTVGSGNRALKSGTESLILAAFVQVEEIHASESAYKAISGMGQAAHALRASLVLHPVPLQKKNAIHLPENQPELMQAGKVNGVILLYHFDEESVVKLAGQTTCVSIAHHHPQVHMDCIGADNSQEFVKLVQYLAGKGHKKIAYIDAGLEASFYDERFAGYMLGQIKTGLPYRPEFVQRGKLAVYGDPAAFEVIHRWIAEGVTALICANDPVAIQALRWLKKNNYRCPEQISVTGFDGISLPPDVPALTTVRVHFQDLGRLAVERLVSRLKEPALPPIRLMEECALVEGQTVAPVGGQGEP